MYPIALVVNYGPMTCVYSGNEREVICLLCYCIADIYRKLSNNSDRYDY